MKTAALRPPRQLDVCLGAKNVAYLGSNPPNSNPLPLTDCDQPGQRPLLEDKGREVCGSWTARRDLYWGLVKDYPSRSSRARRLQAPTCFPGVISKNKTSADVVFTFCAPYPWDGAGGFH